MTTCSIYLEASEPFPFNDLWLKTYSFVIAVVECTILHKPFLNGNKSVHSQNMSYLIYLIRVQALTYKGTP